MTSDLDRPWEVCIFKAKRINDLLWRDKSLKDRVNGVPNANTSRNVGQDDRVQMLEKHD